MKWHHSTSLPSAKILISTLTLPFLISMRLVDFFKYSSNLKYIPHPTTTLPYSKPCFLFNVFSTSVKRSPLKTQVSSCNSSAHDLSVAFCENQSIPSSYYSMPGPIWSSPWNYLSNFIQYFPSHLFKEPLLLQFLVHKSRIFLV